MSDYYSVTSGGPWLDNWLQNHVRVNLVCEGDPEALLENRHSAFWIDSELTLRTARLFLSVWLVGTPDGGLMDLLRAPRRTPPGRTGFIPSSLIHTLSWPYVSCIHFSCEPAAAAEFRLAASALSSEKPLQSDNSRLRGLWRQQHMFGVEALNTSLQVNVGIIGSEEKTYIKNSPKKNPGVRSWRSHEDLLCVAFPCLEILPILIFSYHTFISHFHFNPMCFSLKLRDDQNCNEVIRWLHHIKTCAWALQCAMYLYSEYIFLSLPPYWRFNPKLVLYENISSYKPITSITDLISNTIKFLRNSRLNEVIGWFHFIVIRTYLVNVIFTIHCLQSAVRATSIYVYIFARSPFCPSVCLAPFSQQPRSL